MSKLQAQGFIPGKTHDATRPEETADECLAAIGFAIAIDCQKKFGQLPRLLSPFRANIITLFPRVETLG
jgi:hypothetical protein